MSKERSPTPHDRARHLARVRKYYPAEIRRMNRRRLDFGPDIVERLGNEPDCVIAKELGVVPTTIGEKRRALGIASYGSKRLEAIKRGTPGYHRGGRRKLEK